MGNELAWRNVKWRKIGQDQRCADTFTIMTKGAFVTSQKQLEELKIHKLPVHGFWIGHADPRIRRV